MKIAEVHYLGKLRTEAEHFRSGNALTTDAPVDNRGEGQHFSPTDLAATALASCMLTVMGIKARDKGLKLEGARVDVAKVMASNPRRIAEIHLDLYLPETHIGPQDRQLLEHTARNCPVARSLHSNIRQQIHFHWQPKQKLENARVMKFQVDVKDEKAKSFEKLLEAMKELNVVKNYHMNTEGEPRQEPSQPSADERQQDFANQYRDLVD